MKVKCLECKKQYDYNLKVCPHCGYKNRVKQIINIILYSISTLLLITSILSMLRYHYENETVKNISGYFDYGNMSEVVPKALEVSRTEDYITQYGSKEFGIKAYNLNNFKIWSMSFCIVFIWLGIYLQNKNIKFGKWIKYIAIVIFIICQLVPLGFALSVRNKSIEDTNTITTNNYVNNSEFIPLKEN